MQYLILASAFFSFIFFFILHLIFLRILTVARVMRVLLLAFAIAGIFQIGVLATYYGFFDPFSLIITAALSFILYAGLVFCYILSTLGITLTSLRIQILLEIAEAGAGGLSYNELLGRYNRETIVALSLKRLVGSGELIKHGLYYRSGRRTSFFRFYSKILVLMRKLYGREKVLLSKYSN